MTASPPPGHPWPERAPRTPQEAASVEACAARLRDALGADALEALMTEGAGMDLDQILLQVSPQRPS